MVISEKILNEYSAIDIADLILNNNICCLDIDTYCNFINNNLKKYLNDNDYKKHYASIIVSNLDIEENNNIKDNNLFNIVAENITIDDIECSYLNTSDILELFNTMQINKFNSELNNFLKKVITVARLIKHIIFIYSI